MKYFLYDEASGQIKNYIESPDELTTSYVDGLEIISAEGYCQIDMSTLQIQNGQLVKVPSPAAIATANDIRVKWLQLEQAPIIVSGYSLDCDTLSETRMASCLSNWDYLPLEPGQFELIGGVRKIYWTLGDNTKICVTKSELIYLYNEMVKARAIRALKLHAAFQRMKAMPSVTLDYVNDLTNWLE